MLKKIRYILEYIIVSIFYALFYILPVDIASWLGGKFGELAGLISKTTKTAMRNLDLCYPEKSKEWKKNVVRGMWNNLGRVFAEMPYWKNATSEMFRKRVTIVNVPKKLPHKGLFLAAHLANFELAAIIARELNLKVSLVYRPANNPYVDALISKTRLAHGVKLIKKGKAGVREIVDLLNSGEEAVIGMLIDQKTNDGIDSTFLGIEARTTPFPANIAKKYALPTIMIRFERTTGANYIVAFEEIMTYKKDIDTGLIVEKMNKTIGNWIKERPEQWFWVHKRWSH